ncbi:unnamed protein product [Penicillium salamii]|nr:unnamed protein product [Penicillium salamii]
MRQTLDALAHIVATLKKQTTSSETLDSHLANTSRPRVQGFKLPPIEKVVSLIRLAKSQSLAGTGWIYEVIQFNQFPDMCLGVYFSADYPHGDHISVNAGLHSLFWDYAFQLPDEQREEYFGYARLCRENLETALVDLPLHLPATPNTILALTLGFPFHRALKTLHVLDILIKCVPIMPDTGLSPEDIHEGRLAGDCPIQIFSLWGVYFLDKCLSLRLGRASTIPDSDITLPRPSAGKPNDAPVMAYYPLWTESARLQGRIYDMLYSPCSLAQPNHVRYDQVQHLVSELQALKKETQDVNNRWIKTAKQISGEGLMDFFAVSDDVLHLSLLTLVYRAAPPSKEASTTFSSNCIKTAQATLQRHHDCMEVISKTDNIYFPKYIHWTLLFAPFSPFIVIFCHVIETQDQSYLSHLHDFVESIQSAPTVSEAAARMHRLFLVLYNVALHFVEFRTSKQPGQTPAFAEMDGYLAALGLAAPVSDDVHQQVLQSLNPDSGHDFMAHEYQQREEPTMGIGNEAELDGWFSSNRAIMGLLQDSDLNILDEDWRC